MKRALVEYASSEEEETPVQKRSGRRKLPSLPPSLTVPAPVDDPAQHQGRVRTVPHVEGQYAMYVYVPLVLNRKDALCTLVEDAVTLATAEVPSLRSIGRQERDGAKVARWELHISLSRPLFLRAHQREEFKRAIKRVASSLAPFDASFTSFTALTNDERTRTFLAMELGAGHQELRRCLDLLGPTLRSLRQKEFYDDPKFHASIAWALLEKTPSCKVAPLSVSEDLGAVTSPECTGPEEQPSRPPSPSTAERSTDTFLRISHFPPTLVPSLNETYAARLSQARTGGFVVDKISVKIGRDILTLPLGGIR